MEVQTTHVTPWCLIQSAPKKHSPDSDHHHHAIALDRLRGRPQAGQLQSFSGIWRLIRALFDIANQ